MRKRLLVYIHYLEIGGAERALLGMLEGLDPLKWDVDLLVGRHTGDFMALIPEWINLLPQYEDYAAVERPIIEIIREGQISIALRRMAAKIFHAAHRYKLSQNEKDCDESIYQYIYRSVTPCLRTLDGLGIYDVALSFLHPHNIVRDKVKAHRKVCWVHTDYSSTHINTRLEYPVWSAFDKIVCVSEDTLRAFESIFPTLRHKLVVMENIISPYSLREQSRMSNVSLEMPMIPDELRLLSVGRFSPAKRFEDVPEMCRIMLDMGLRFKWYIIGYGDDMRIRGNIAKHGVADTLVILGKKQNPYPYIAASDLYVQPSLYEGKSLTVREAQILCVPPVVSAYPTASSQICSGTDGVIVPMDVERCAKGIFAVASDSKLRERICSYLKTHDYGYTSEIDKLYNI